MEIEKNDDLNPAHVELANQAQEVLEKKFNLKKAGVEEEIEARTALEQSFLINGYDACWWDDALTINGSEIILVNMYLSWSTPKGSSREYCEFQTVGVARLKKDYGHTLIRPETIVDKVSELFRRTEIDFSFHKEFSSKYFVVTESEYLLHEFASEKILDLIYQLYDAYIEILNDHLIIQFKKIVSAELSLQMAEFLVALKEKL